MHSFTPPRHIRVCRDICWYTRYFFTILPDILSVLSFAALIILLPIMAAFFA